MDGDGPRVPDGGDDLGSLADGPVLMTGNMITANDDGVTATHGAHVKMMDETVKGNGDGLNTLDGSTADVDDSRGEVELWVHWSGGHHTVFHAPRGGRRGLSAAQEAKSGGVLVDGGFPR